MEGDDVEGGEGLGEVVRRGEGDEVVGDAVEAVFAELVVLGDGLVDGVGADVLRGGLSFCSPCDCSWVWTFSYLGDGGMESRVEIGNVGCAGELLANGADDCEGAGVVSAAICINTAP